MGISRTPQPAGQRVLQRNYGLPRNEILKFERYFDHLSYDIISTFMRYYFALFWNFGVDLDYLTLLWDFNVILFYQLDATPPFWLWFFNFYAMLTFDVSVQI